MAGACLILEFSMFFNLGPNFMVRIQTLGYEIQSWFHSGCGFNSGNINCCRKDVRILNFEFIDFHIFTYEYLAEYGTCCTSPIFCNYITKTFKKLGSSGIKR